MKQNKQSRIVAILALCVSVVGLTLGFAAFSNTLTISSSATVSPDSSDFKLVAYGIENIDLLDSINWLEPDIYTSKTISRTENGEDAVISSAFTENGSNKIMLSNLKANFKEPGGSVLYFFMIKNEGHYDAYLMASELEKYENIIEKSVCEAVVEDGKTPATQEYVDAACEEITLEMYVYGGDGMDDTLQFGGNVDEYIKIPKFGSSFRGYNYGYAIALVTITYNGPTRVDGDFTVDFADVELEFTTTPPAA